MKVIINEWSGCYPSNWKGLIIPDAMSHPAKFSSKLIRRIYQNGIPRIDYETVYCMEKMK